MPPSPTARKQGPLRRLRFPFAVLAALALAASACSDDDTTSESSTEQSSIEETTTNGAIASTDDEGTTSVDDERLDTELNALPTATLSDADSDGLIFMREEEKLALDVYRELHEVWGLAIFDNISAAEQTHTDSVKTLLDRYDIADPAVDQATGVFQNADLQTLYNDLVARGSESTTEALLVGALIEDLDIADLQARASDEPAIALVYSNLERGSRNHLRAFIANSKPRARPTPPANLSSRLRLHHQLSNRTRQSMTTGGHPDPGRDLCSCNYVTDPEGETK